MINSFARYIVRRLVISILTMWVIATFSFFLLHMLPGNPFASTRILSMEMQSRLIAYYGLDRPIMEQYFTYMDNLLRGDFGYSYKYSGQSVNTIINRTFPVSAQLGLQAYLFSFPIGIMLGTVAAHKRRKPIDYSLVVFSALGASVPVFILGSLLQYVFAIKLGLFPIARWQNWASTILPSITLAIGLIAVKTRIMRTLMLEIISEEYIKTAKAKGLPKWHIIWSHQIRNAIIPILSYMGIEVAFVLMGSFVVEQIYAIPGLGAYFVTSIQNMDYTMVLGLTVFFSFFVVSANLIIDLAYGLIDPRIRITA
jgi:oligopeptide transport system permease protein